MNTDEDRLDFPIWAYGCILRRKNLKPRTKIGCISRYRDHILAIPKRRERSRSELQFRLKNDSIWSRKTGVMAARRTGQNLADLSARRKLKGNGLEASHEGGLDPSIGRDESSH